MRARKHIAAALAISFVACGTRVGLAAPGDKPETAIENRGRGAGIAVVGGAAMAVGGVALVTYGALPCHGTCDSRSLGVALGVPALLGGVALGAAGLRDLGAARAMRRTLRLGHPELVDRSGRASLERFSGEAEMWGGITLLGLAPIPLALGLSCSARENCGAPALYYAAGGVGIAAGSLSLWLGLEDVSAARHDERRLGAVGWTATPACSPTGCSLSLSRQF